jgi:hypothetical protein
MPLKVKTGEGIFHLYVVARRAFAGGALDSLEATSPHNRGTTLFCPHVATKRNGLDPAIRKALGWRHGEKGRSKSKQLMP